MQTKAIVFVEPIICEVFVDQITLINCESLKEIGKMAFVESARSSCEQIPKSLAQNEITGIFFFFRVLLSLGQKKKPCLRRL